MDRVWVIMGLHNKEKVKLSQEAFHRRKKPLFLKSLSRKLLVKPKATSRIKSFADLQSEFIQKGQNTKTISVGV